MRRKWKGNEKYEMNNLFFIFLLIFSFFNLLIKLVYFFDYLMSSSLAVCGFFEDRCVSDCTKEPPSPASWPTIKGSRDGYFLSDTPDFLSSAFVLAYGPSEESVWHHSHWTHDLVSCRCFQIFCALSLWNTSFILSKFVDKYLRKLSDSLRWTWHEEIVELFVFHICTCRPQLRAPFLNQVS
jgi:hypothetical protein